MKKLGVAIAFVLIISSSNAYTQQRGTVCCGGATTCRQALAFCNRGCESLDKPRTCQGNCQEQINTCMSTGVWRNPLTGKEFDLRRE
jgi:hypothetical protein